MTCKYSVLQSVFRESINKPINCSSYSTLNILTHQTSFLICSRLTSKRSRKFDRLPAEQYFKAGITRIFMEKAIKKFYGKVVPSTYRGFRKNKVECFLYSFVVLATMAHIRLMKATSHKIHIKFCQGTHGMVLSPY